MWQFYSLGSLFAGAFESIIDKAGIVRDGGVDSYVASLYRASFFWIAALIVGATGLLGEITFFFHWSYLPLALVSAIATLLFTYLLRNVEITVLGAASYLAPSLFLLIDTKVLGIALTQLQLIGIVLLVSGGLAFTLDGKTHHFRRDFGWRIWGSLFFLYVFGVALEAYLFKYLHVAHGVNAVSFYAVSTIPIIIILFAILLWKRRLPLLFNRSARMYIPFAILGKSFDSLNSILYVTALGMATLAQVSAFNALMPLMIIIVALFAQGLFGVRLKEHLDHKRTLWKFSAAVVLVVGGLLVG